MAEGGLPPFHWEMDHFSDLSRVIVAGGEFAVRRTPSLRIQPIAWGYRIRQEQV